MAATALLSQTRDLAGSQSGGPAAAPAAPPASLQLPIKARTHEEYLAYQAAIANKQNPEAMERAAADFAAKFPDSPIRLLLYRAVMKSYHAAGDPKKMMDAGLKVLELDKNDPEALIAVAEVQEEHTTPMDLDRDQRMSQALANGQRALQTIDTDLVVPVGTPADRIEPYKKYLRSSALAIIGAIQYKREQYAEAESTLRRSLEADPDNPDGVVVLRLALCLDRQKKYPDALEQARHAVELTKDDSDAGRVARTELDRLNRLLTGKGDTADAGTSTDNPETAVPAGQEQ
jgi:tetratricopeptide (TPR) repeat protein